MVCFSKSPRTSTVESHHQPEGDNDIARQHHQSVRSHDRQATSYARNDLPRHNSYHGNTGKEHRSYRPPQHRPMALQPCGAIRIMMASDVKATTTIVAA
jgi:hypothetical protein